MSKPVVKKISLARLARRGKLGVLLEAEVAPKQQQRFAKRYKTTTGQKVSPGNPQYYQHQPNKWGSELRLYFNDATMAASLQALGIHVEYRQRGYKAGQYRYRFNDNKLWWKLVNKYRLRLGPN
jgi:hypothetical protein